jgi:hypothetical protein
LNDRQFEKNKTLIEIETQIYINYVNILIASLFAILISIWLSGENSLFPNIRYKVYVSCGIVFLGIIIFIILDSKIQNLKNKLKALPIKK